MSPQPAKKQRTLDRVADENGVAVVVLDENSQEVSASNNNSICRALTSSAEFAPKCAEYCGMAFKNTASGKDFDYHCHAGLTCKAVPVADRGKRFVAIVGRAFTTADSYRKATDKAIKGEWNEFSPKEFFDNVLMTGSGSKIEKAAGELSKYRVTESDNVLELDRSPRVEPPKPKVQRPKVLPQVQRKPEPVTQQITKLVEAFHDTKKPEIIVPSVKKDHRALEAASLRSFYGKLAKLDYDGACSAVLEYVRDTSGLKSLIWFRVRETHLVTAAAIGALRETPIKVGINSKNARLVTASREGKPLELRERVTDESGRAGRVLSLFPSAVSGEIHGVIGVEGPMDDETSRAIARFGRVIAPQIEILRLQHEVSSRDWLNRAVTRFNESLTRIDAEDFWTHVTQVSAELVQSERASLLLRNEQTDKLFVKASLGTRADLSAVLDVGQRVSKLVLDDGKPVLVEDIKRIGVRSAPPDWRYRTSSFLSFPILIGDRRIGVMNFTDKASGEVFDDRDLELLQAIAPQIAVAIDRTVLKDKAGEFEQLSVTDALTGLLNRRYLAKRLAEEIQRSKRHRFPMSLMMLDVDEFKSYNDEFGHPAGDAALKIVANVLQDILRGADVAARYGGEEFAILLPQTTSHEAAAIAERLRQRIEHTEFPKRKVTVSIGIAACSNDIETPEDIIGAADHALYDAKNHGRNNVQIYDGFGKAFNDKIN